MAAAGGASTGIILALTFNSGETLVLERDDGGGYVTVASLKGGDQEYTDTLPLNGVTYTYRAKVQRAGYADSSYSATDTGVPPDLSVL